MEYQAKDRDIWLRLEEAVKDHAFIRGMDDAGWDDDPKGRTRPLLKMLMGMSASAIALLSSTRDVGPEIKVSMLDLPINPGLHDGAIAGGKSARLEQPDHDTDGQAAGHRIDTAFDAAQKTGPLKPGIGDGENAEPPAVIAGFDSLGRSLLHDGIATIGRRDDGTPLTITTRKQPDQPPWNALFADGISGTAKGRMDSDFERRWALGFADNENGIAAARTAPNPDATQAGWGQFAGDFLGLEDTVKRLEAASRVTFETMDFVAKNRAAAWQPVAQMPSDSAINLALDQAITEPPENLTIGQMVGRVIETEIIARDQYLPMVLTRQKFEADTPFDPANPSAHKTLTEALEIVVKGQQAIEGILLANHMVDGMQGKENLHYLLGKASIESGFDATVKASTSSAKGLFQVINNTWLALVHEHGAKYGLADYAADISFTKKGVPRVEAGRTRKAEILALRDNPALNAIFAAEYTADNDRTLQAGIGKRHRITDTDRYIMHFLGPGGAKLIRNALGSRANFGAAAAFPDAAKANKSIFYTRNAKGQRVQRSYSGIRNLFVGKTRYVRAALNGSREPWLKARGYITWPSGEEMAIADLPLPVPRPDRQLASADVDARITATAEHAPKAP